MTRVFSPERRNRRAALGIDASAAEAGEQELGRLLRRLEAEAPTTGIKGCGQTLPWRDHGDPAAARGLAGGHTGADHAPAKGLRGA
jgi:hypothetical protein